MGFEFVALIGKVGAVMAAAGFLTPECSGRHEAGERDKIAGRCAQITSGDLVECERIQRVCGKIERRGQLPNGPKDQQ